MGVWGVFPSLPSFPLVAANHTVGELATQLVVSIDARGIGKRMAPLEESTKGPARRFPMAATHKASLICLMNRSSRGDPCKASGLHARSCGWPDPWRIHNTLVGI